MKTRKIVLFAVIVVVLITMITLTGCNWFGAKPVPTATPMPSTTPVPKLCKRSDGSSEVGQVVIFEGQSKMCVKDSEGNPYWRDVTVSFVTTTAPTSTAVPQPTAVSPTTTAVPPTPVPPTAVPPTPTITFTATNTPIAAAPAAQPTAVVITNSLKYDEIGCPPNNIKACLTLGQTEFVAIYVRNIQSGDKTLVQGIVAIQQLFAAVPTAHTWDKWSSLTADKIYPTFVWCPGNNCSFPPDSAFPLMGIAGLKNVQFSIAIVSAHTSADPAANLTTVTCPNGDCWAGLLR